MTTASFPSIVTPLRSSSSIQPCGVQDTWKSILSKDQAPRPPCVFVFASCATFNGCKPIIDILVNKPQFMNVITHNSPSTSLSCVIVCNTAASSICPGNGSCTRIPFTLGSSFNSLTLAINSS